MGTSTMWILGGWGVFILTVMLAMRALLGGSTARDEDEPPPK